MLIRAGDNLPMAGALGVNIQLLYRWCLTPRSFGRPIRCHGWAVVGRRTWDGRRHVDLVVRRHRHRGDWPIRGAGGMVIIGIVETVGRSILPIALKPCCPTKRRRRWAPWRLC